MHLMALRVLNSSLKTSPLKRSLAALAALALVTPAVASAAEIYRWVDENGVVNYTQQAPRGVEAELVGKTAQRPRQRNGANVQETADSSSAALPPGLTTPREPELTPEQQKILDDLKAAEADRQAALVEAKASNCARARQVLVNLTKIGRVRVVADDGTQSVLPEEERQRRISDAQEAIAVNCAG